MKHWHFLMGFSIFFIFLSATNAKSLTFPFRCPEIETVRQHANDINIAYYDEEYDAWYTRAMGAIDEDLHWNIIVNLPAGSAASAEEAITKARQLTSTITQKNQEYAYLLTSGCFACEYGPIVRLWSS